MKKFVVKLIKSYLMTQLLTRSQIGTRDHPEISLQFLPVFLCIKLVMSMIYFGNFIGRNVYRSQDQMVVFRKKALFYYECRGKCQDSVSWLITRDFVYVSFTGTSCHLRCWYGIIYSRLFRQRVLLKYEISNLIMRLMFL